MSSLRKVARTCQVSPMTVSLVLNDPHTARVSTETRARVLKVVRDLGYRPKPRAIEADGIKTIGVIAPVDASLFNPDSYSGRVLQGVLKQVESRRYNLMLFATELFRQKDIHGAIRTYCDGKCDGLIMVAPNRNSPLAVALAMRGIPLVIIGTSEPFDDLSDAPMPAMVDVDNVAIGREATAYLISLGHQRIGMIQGPDFVVSAVQRRSGYEQAMAERGFSVDPDWVSEQVPKVRNTQLIVEKMLDLPAAQRPTALFCWNDGTAHEALEVLHTRGLAVPEQMSLIGVDDATGDVLCEPPLTTFRQPFEEMGAWTLNSLRQQLEFSIEAVVPGRQLFQAALVVRESAVSPRQH